MMVQDWLNKWNDSQSDVQNTLNFLQGYVSNANTSSSINPSNNARISEVADAISNFKQLDIGFKRLYCSVEYILARLKQEIYNYQGYSFCSSSSRVQMIHNNNYSFRERKNHEVHPNEFLAYAFMQENKQKDFFHYKVIDPENNIVSAKFDLNKLRGYQLNSIDRAGQLLPYEAEILEFTSKLGHTRGPNINETDDLASLLEAVKIKTGVNYFNLDHKDILDRYDNMDMPEPINDVSKWHKQGDFTVTLNHHSLKHSVFYSNTSITNSIINSIRLSQYKNGKLALTVTTSKNETFSLLEQRLVSYELPPITGCRIIVGFCQIKNDHKNCYELHTNSHIRRSHGEPNFNYFQYHDATGTTQSLRINNVTKFKAIFPYFADTEGDVQAVTLTSALMHQLIPLINHTPPAFGSSEKNEYTLYAPNSSEENLELLGRLLDVILDVDPSTTDVFKELCGLLNIHYVQQNKDDVQTAIDQAIDAQTNKIYHPIWDLAITYRDDFYSDDPHHFIMIDQLIRLFKSITVNNPHYAEANYELSNLIVSTERNGANNYSLLQQQFRYAFRSKDQEYIDNLYNELCGRGLMSPEKITGIKGDEDILLALAAQLNEANKKLKLLCSIQTNNSSNSNDTPAQSYASNSNTLFNSTEVQEQDHEPPSLLLANPSDLIHPQSKP